MGCNIHLHVELKHEDGRWLHYAQPNIERWYALFAKMADVRNNGEIEAISKPKGFPSDMSEITKVFCAYIDGHSPTWLSSDEVLILEQWLKDQGDPEKYCLATDLEHSILHTYLNGNSFCAFKQYDDYEYMPKPFIDFRFVFWFDN